MFASDIVSEALVQQTFGCSKTSRTAVNRYLRRKASARPQISHFFDAEFYVQKYPDIQQSDLDPFLHFMSDGCRMGRSPHPLVDLDFMRSIDPHLLPDSFGPDYLYEILHFGLADSSPYFSLEYYGAQRHGHTEGLLAHFLTEGIHQGLRPNPLFDPAWYCRRLQGSHDVRSGLRHFVLSGDREGYAPSPEFSGRRYFLHNPDVIGAGIPALAHYLTNGKAEGRPIYPENLLPERGVACDEHTRSPLRSDYERSKELIRRTLQDQKDRVSARAPAIVAVSAKSPQPRDLSLPGVKTPKVSILIPIYNGLAYTLECLTSLVRSKPKTAYEVIIADDGSTDGSGASLRAIKNIKIIAQTANVGFLANCNAAFTACRGEYVLLLNNDTQLLPGALDSLVAVLDAHPDVGAVGPKIIYPDGRLQEAGCTLDRDGIAGMVGLFADPDSPQYSYEREVHYCSGAALLIRRSDIAEPLFDARFKPAYCEDADLCLSLLARQRKVMYCPHAEVVHHLSASMTGRFAERRLHLIVRNQQKLAAKWADLLTAINRARVIAFYLPQYYPTPENDRYWGTGFTEWTNVARATPAYEGHYQPHLPADLGFYDLRVPDTVTRQTTLARRYGVSGFCVYYYNFGSCRTLHQAFEAIVADQNRDFPFCVCWANENWTRRWDGGDQEILFEQQYDEATRFQVMTDAVRYASDPRYMRVNNKPLFLVYRPLSIPDVQRFTTECRRHFRDAGFAGVHLVYVESMETAAAAAPPEDLGFDACVEFPPHGRGVAVDKPRTLIRDDFVGMQYDYQAAVLSDLHRPPVAYRRYPTTFPSWDNTPRHPQRGDSFIEPSPEVFQTYIEAKLDYLKDFFVGDERLLFINAWNEWAEGTHLEPDMRFGHRWLEALRNALLAKLLA